MRVYASACFVLAFYVAASLQDTPHASCSDGPLPKSLRVKGCDKSPCNLYRGTDLTAEWDFVAESDVDKLETRVRVKIGGNTINYPYPQPDACKSLSNGECPLEKGDEATYNLRMPISKGYPSVSLNIEFALVDEKNKIQVCFKLDCKVVSK